MEALGLLGGFAVFELELFDLRVELPEPGGVLLVIWGNLVKGGVLGLLFYSFEEGCYEGAH